MTVRAVEHKSNDAHLRYPCLKVWYDENDATKYFVVLFHEHRKGTVVYASEELKSTDRQPGKYSEHWLEDKFEAYNQTVMLCNG